MLNATFDQWPHSFLRRDERLRAVLASCGAASASVLSVAIELARLI
jgi:hypothetical protein